MSILAAAMQLLATSVKSLPLKRSVKVGWLLQTEKAAFIWDSPRIFSRPTSRSASSKAVQLCPAVLDFEARFAVVPCPFDLHLRYKFDPAKGPGVQNMLGDKSPINNKQLGELVAFSKPSAWRHSERPVLQIQTPYTFVADEPVYLNQMPPFLDYNESAWPGVLISGRFPTHIWPRQLMWAFEWHDTSKDLILARGSPWFYVRFEAHDPSRPVRLVEAE